jgi:hypothetical protein
MFGDIRWSSSHALADTLAGLKGLSVAFSETLGDVDCAADLVAAGPGFGRRILSPAPPTIDH